MTTQNDPNTAAARSQIFLQSARIGRVFNRTFAFYAGNPVASSFTGNLVLGGTSGGAAAALINGAGPPIVTPIPCDEPTISAVEVTFLPDNVQVVVTYDSPLPDDIYVLFNSGGESFGPLSAIQTGADEVTLLFADDEDLAAGLYSLKILRAADPVNCFSVRRGIFNIESFVCTIAVTGWSGPGISPNPPLTSGTNDVVASVTGSGFLSGPLTVTIFPFLGGPSNLNIDSVTVFDDNNLDVQFDTDAVETGSYAVRVELTADPTCFDQYGEMFGENALNVQLV